ncbi:Hpt domain-containing protein [Winogradskyella undariae]|uniref:Hpt domain-containing protein n=1 Tax=Winogradskyella undariae TaxID=1285465 RepID=UPI00156B6333|nr:Hpt domain-containing protein [Winogradskyella undariae]NRR90101.1 Hpt domain-containing protein [Winogradskyella undariae]QNK76543.1 Hpt domain-containing protein [Winogradskyella sp. PAMC22761]
MEEPNLSYIYSMSGGDKAFEEKLIGIIKSEFPEEKAEYYNNLKANNYKLVAGNVHKLKHKISILGLEKSYEIAIAFENNLLEGSTKLQDQFESILKTITNYLQKL